MADSDEVNVSSLLKMKVADLKRELKARGLSTAGNKNELIERLQGLGEDVSNLESVGLCENDNDGGNDTIVDGDVMDESGNQDESELLDEDDVLEDGLDDELSVGAVSETNDSVSFMSQMNSGSKHNDEPPMKQATKRKLMSATKKTELSSAHPPKKITLNRNSSLSMGVASEKENQASQNQGDSSDIKELKELTGECSDKKVVKLSGISVKERLELRAQKFGTPLSDAAKREARAIRFGLTASFGASSVPVATAEVLKKRAERFGTAVSPILKKTELEEKMKIRQQRFNVAPSNDSSGLNLQTKADLEEKRRLRAERFKIAST